MLNTALITSPSSLTQSCPTFRPGYASACGAGLRRPSLIGFNKHCTPSGAFISQHLSECAPSCIQDRLGHLGFCKGSSIHISNNNDSVLASHLGARNMELMTTRIGYFGVDRTNARFISGSLGNAQSDFVSPIVAQIWNFGTIAACSKRFESQVDTNLANPHRQIIGKFAGKSRVPASTGVLNESARFEFAGNFAMPPKAKSLFKIANTVAFDLGGTGNVGNPSKRALRAKTRAKSWAFFLGISGLRELAANLGNCIGVQPKFFGTTGAQFPKIKLARPATASARSVTSLRFTLSGNAKIPDLIAADGEFNESLAAGAVFDSELEGDDTHFGSVLSQLGLIKSASSDCRRATRSLFITHKERRFLPGLKAEVSAPNI